METIPMPKTLSEGDLARFWAKVACDIDPEGCWAWLGRLNEEGRGRFTAQGVTTYAYRYAWLIACGSLEDGLVVRHRCKNPTCVRVGHGHLEIGPQRENNLDTAEDGCNKLAKLDAEKARAIRERLAGPDPPTTTALALEYDVRPTTISRVARGASWPRAGGPIWPAQERKAKCPELAQA